MSNKKHTFDELKMMQALPLDIKIRMTEERIRSFVREFGVDGCYIAYSGGKDSTVLYDLVRKIYPEIPAVFNDTGLEFPEVRDMAIEKADVILKPEMNFKNIIKEYGYPLVSKEVSKNVYYARRNGEEDIHYKKLFGMLMTEDGKISKYNTKKWSFLFYAPFLISHRCCEKLKKSPSLKYSRREHRYPITGEMACEGRMRATAWMRTGCNVYDSEKAKSKPLSFWTDQDVLSYIKKNNLEIPSVYGAIIQDSKGNLTTSQRKRTGCVFCAFGAHLEKEPNRFQLLAITHPALWDYCVNGGEYDVNGLWKPNKEGLGMGKVLDYIGVKYNPDIEVRRCYYGNGYGDGYSYDGDGDGDGNGYGYGNDGFGTGYGYGYGYGNGFGFRLAEVVLFKK